jgi:phospholipase A-2-activating protein
LWCCICLSNSTLAVACSDGSIRLFTQNPALMASKAEMEEYESTLGQFAIPTKSNPEISPIDSSKLPGLEALSEPGQRDGQNKLINNNNQIEVYVWSNLEQKWEKIGVAVGSSGSAGGSSSSRQKVSFEGKVIK